MLQRYITRCGSVHNMGNRSIFNLVDSQKNFWGCLDMTTYTYTQEQRDEIERNLLKIQMNLNNPEIINNAVVDIYKILYLNTTKKIYNPVTKKSYEIKERSSVNKESGSIVGGLWSKE